LLAGCAQTPSQQPARIVQTSEWQRPASYDPPGPAHDPWGPYIAQASRRFDIPEAWIREVMRQESGGRAGVTSHAGAMGLMQVMPGTYRELQARYDLGPDPYHPWDSLMAGTAYLREMYQLYGNPAFLAAYNAGPRRLEDYLWGNRGLPNETRNYVARIGPRIQHAHPNRRAAPEIYAAAEMPLRVPPGPRRGDPATMLALREQRRAAQQPVQFAQLPPGPVVRMETVDSASAYVPPPTTAPAAAPPQRTQLASALPQAPRGPVVAMSPIVSPGDTMRMEPIVSPGDPGTVEALAQARIETRMEARMQAEALPPLAAAPTRGFSLIPSAQAGTLPARPRPTAAAPAPAGRGWGIQVGAFASENLARASASHARDRVALLGTRSVVEPTAAGRTTLYRARVIGLGTRAAAEQACDRVRPVGGCMVVAPGA
jgi:cell division protein FtsN